MQFRRPADDEPELNLIPMIDVMLIVLIFLAVSTTYARFSELQIELPTASTDKTQNRNNEVHIAVTADGRYAIDKVLTASNDAGSLAELLKRAASGRPNPLIVINADAQAPHQAVITVMEAARGAGFVRISFATQRRSSAAK